MISNMKYKSLKALPSLLPIYIQSVSTTKTFQFLQCVLQLRNWEEGESHKLSDKVLEAQIVDVDTTQASMLDTAPIGLAMNKKF